MICKNQIINKSNIKYIPGINKYWGL